VHRAGPMHAAEELLLDVDVAAAAQAGDERERTRQISPTASKSSAEARQDRSSPSSVTWDRREAARGQMTASPGSRLDGARQGWA
jgi:hypothetical protein